MLDDKLANASPEELRQHIDVQRDLIRRLHRRVVDLEAALESEYTRQRTPPAAKAQSTSPSNAWGSDASARMEPIGFARPVPLPTPSPDAPRGLRVATDTASITDGLREINRVLGAHAAQRPTLPPEVIAELLLIRSTLLRDTSQSLARAIHEGSEYSLEGDRGSQHSGSMLTPLGASRGVVNPKWVSPEASRVVYGSRACVPGTAQRRSRDGREPGPLDAPRAAASRSPPTAVSPGTAGAAASASYFREPGRNGLLAGITTVPHGGTSSRPFPKSRHPGDNAPVSGSVPPPSHLVYDYFAPSSNHHGTKKT